MIRKLCLLLLLALVAGTLMADAAIWPVAPEEVEDLQENYMVFTGLSELPGSRFAVVQNVEEMVGEGDDAEYQSYYNLSFAKGDSLSFQVWSNTKPYRSFTVLTCDPKLYGRPGTSVKKKRVKFEMPDWGEPHTRYSMLLYQGQVPLGFQRTELYYRVSPAPADEPEGRTFFTRLEKVVLRHPDFVLTSTGDTEALLEQTSYDYESYSRLLNKDKVSALLSWAREQAGVSVEMTPQDSGKNSKKLYSIPFAHAAGAQSFGIGLSILAGIAVLGLFIIVLGRGRKTR